MRSLFLILILSTQLHASVRATEVLGPWDCLGLLLTSVETQASDRGDIADVAHLYQPKFLESVRDKRGEGALQLLMLAKEHPEQLAYLRIVTGRQKVFHRLQEIQNAILALQDGVPPQQKQVPSQASPLSTALTKQQQLFLARFTAILGVTWICTEVAGKCWIGHQDLVPALQQTMQGMGGLWFFVWAIRYLGYVITPEEPPREPLERVVFPVSRVKEIQGEVSAGTPEPQVDYWSGTTFPLNPRLRAAYPDLVGAPTHSMLFVLSQNAQREPTLLVALQELTKKESEEEGK